MKKKKLRRKILRRAAKFAFDTLADSAAKPATGSGSGSEKAGQGKEKPAPKTVGSIVIRELRRNDRTEVTEMMREALKAKAALTTESDAVFKRNIAECLSDRKLLDGFVFAYKDADDSLWGYALVGHGFSIETGKPCIRIEELYLREEARDLGLTQAFRDYMGEVYAGE